MAKSWTSLPRRLRCNDCAPEGMSVTMPVPMPLALVSDRSSPSIVAGPFSSLECCMAAMTTKTEQRGAGNAER
jgi:hypothetical protein